MRSNFMSPKRHYVFDAASGLDSRVSAMNARCHVVAVAQSDAGVAVSRVQRGPTGRRTSGENVESEGRESLAGANHYHSGRTEK
jgi:hypothetical protein